MISTKLICNESRVLLGMSILLERGYSWQLRGKEKMVKKLYKASIETLPESVYILRLIQQESLIFTKHLTSLLF